MVSNHNGQASGELKASMWSVVTSDFPLRAADPNWQLDFGNKPKIFIWVLGQTQDIYVRFQNQTGIFIMDLEADQGPAGATTPT